MTLLSIYLLLLAHGVLSCRSLIDCPAVLPLLDVNVK